MEIDDLPAGSSPARRRMPAGAVPAGTSSVQSAIAKPAGIGAPTSILRGSHVTKSFDGIRALAGVDINVEAGEIIGLIGPNGSGKTTLLNVVSGVYPATTGEIIFQDHPIGGRKAHQVADLGLARTFQNIRLFSQLTVRENVEATSPPGTDERSVDEVLEWFGLAAVQREKATNLAYGSNGDSRSRAR